MTTKPVHCRTAGFLSVPSHWLDLLVPVCERQAPSPSVNEIRRMDGRSYTGWRKKRPKHLHALFSRAVEMNQLRSIA